MLPWGDALIVVAATILGPFLALLIFRYVLFDTINPLGGSDALVVGLAPDMFIMGAAGGLLSLAVLLASGAGLARRGLLDFLRERARPPTVPYLQRYYIDLLVIALLAVVWWQVESRGGFVEQTLVGRQVQVETSLLLAPALILLVVSFLVLRLLPALVRLLGWVARRMSVAWVSFALSRVARDPLPFGSLTVIVMLAAALGIFGASFQSTLSRSQREQALYRAGGDLVVNVIAPTGETQRNLRDIPAVEALSLIGRESVTLLDVSPGSSATLFAVDPVSFPEVAWFRNDFTPSGKDLPDLLTPLRRSQSRLPDLSGSRASGVPIPEDAQSVGVWINIDALGDSIVQQTMRLWLRVSDADGSYVNLDLGTIQLDGGGLSGGVPGSVTPGQGSGRAVDWTYFEAPLPLEQAWLDLPFSVVSLYFVGKSLYRMPPGAIHLDDITAKPGLAGSGSEDGLVIEDFENPGRWVTLPHDGKVADVIEANRQAGRNGGNGLLFSWEDPILQTPRGLLIPPGPFPLPAIGGPGFAPGQAVRLDTGTEQVPILIQDTVGYFPTMQLSRRPFVVVSVDTLAAYTRRTPGECGRLPGNIGWAWKREPTGKRPSVQCGRQLPSPPISETGLPWWTGRSETRWPAAAGTD